MILTNLFYKNQMIKKIRQLTITNLLAQVKPEINLTNKKTKSLL